ncbi:MAG: hypothetical protein JW809_10525 [Pirellulales bacterium]|nr:hypothetical protein [Pirellulales bacterium]
MGLMRFVVSPPDRITPELARQAYLSGFERIPWRGTVEFAEGELAIARNVTDSGNLHVPWPVEGHGVLALSTASLMERPQPYHLPLELARGKIALTRNQLADWQSIGLVVPPSVPAKIAEAQKHLAHATAGDPTREASVRAAETALRTILDAGAHLTECYVEQALALRRRHARQRPCLLGADLGVSLLDRHAAAQFVESFGAARVPLTWREVETSEGSRNWEIFDRQLAWCRSAGLQVCGGPLVHLAAGSAPDWLMLFEGDLAGLQASVSDFLKAAVARYRGQVALWQCTGRTNTADFLNLEEEELVQLTAQAVEEVRRLDPDTPRVVSFDQPWAEYTARRDADFPPFYFADALVRADLGLSGLMLEVNLGYEPGGTLPRDPLEFSRQLDMWSVLGVPIYVALCVPSGNGPDPFARRKSPSIQPGCSPATQQAWLARYLPVVLAKTYVRGVVWSQLHDYAPHDFSHGGLFDLRRHPKPALRTFASIRQAYL